MPFKGVHTAAVTATLFSHSIGSPTEQRCGILRPLTPGYYSSLRLQTPVISGFGGRNILPAEQGICDALRKEEARGFILLELNSTKGEWGSVHSLKGCLRKYQFRMLTLSYRSRRSVFFNQPLGCTFPHS